MGTVKDPAAESEDDSKYARRPLTAEEIRYMQGDKQPVAPSVLISNSKYLNDPLYRDTFAQSNLRRNGNDVEPTYMIPLVIKAVANVTEPAEVREWIEEEKAVNPEFAAFLQNHLDQDFRLENTAHYPEGTFGAAVHQFLLKGYKIDFMYANETLTDVAYMAKRLLAVHDIGHIVTGFGPNMVGEGALAMCTLTTHINYFTPRMASYINHVVSWIPGSQIMKVTLHYPEVAPTLFDGLRQGIAAGQAIRQPFFMTDWSRYLDWQLDDLAKELGFVRGPGADWDWTTAAARG